MSQRFWLQQLGFLAVLAALCLTLTGCGSGKVTKENFDKLTVGMPEKDVKDVLGEPTEKKTQPSTPAVKDEAGKETSAETKAGDKLIWTSGDKTIYVVIVDGKVTAKHQSGLVKDMGSAK